MLLTFTNFGRIFNKEFNHRKDFWEFSLSCKNFFFVTAIPREVPTKVCIGGTPLASFGEYVIKVAFIEGQNFCHTGVVLSHWGSLPFSKTLPMQLSTWSASCLGLICADAFGHGLPHNHPNSLQHHTGHGLFYDHHDHHQQHIGHHHHYYHYNHYGTRP